MIRALLLASVLAFVIVPTAQAGTVASCDRLEHETRNIELDPTDIDLEGEDLVLRASGAELVHIDAQRNLFIARRPVAVPADAKPQLDAYVAGFRALGEDAKQLGKHGGMIAAQAISGLVEVLFTSTTTEDYERRMEAAGKDVAAHADRLCRTVAELRRTETALQQRIPAFPAFLVPVEPSL